MASTRLALALTLMSSKNRNDEARENLEQALMLYRQIVDREGEARASLFLGELYSNKKDAKKAKEYFEKVPQVVA